MDKNSKKRIFSGVQPSGNLHLGNFLGAISAWVKLQNEYECIFCVVDYHAITIKQDPQVLKDKIIEVAKIYLAAGIDPAKSIIFQQSVISAHTELAWILNTIAKIPELERMTQFKDKAVRERQGVGVGLFTYPVLMAADILLYNTDAVPVGEDQAQHVELARVLGRRFNKEFGEAFRIPNLIIRKEGARIMGLDDPAKKMSKSAESEYNYIALTDRPEKARQKIKKAVTDSGKEVEFNLKSKPALSNLLTIYSLLSGESIKSLEKKYKSEGYGKFKDGLAEAVAEFLFEFQKELKRFSDEEVKDILKAGADRAKPAAELTLRRVKELIGIN